MSSNQGQLCRDLMGKRILLKGATFVDENRHLTIKSAKINGNIDVGNGGFLKSHMCDQTGWNLYRKIRDATVSIAVNGNSCSGWFTSPDGWVITAAHCMLPTDTSTSNVLAKISPSIANVLVTSVNGVTGVDRFMQPTEIYMDAAGDIAVLKLPGLTSQDYLEWGNSQIACIGNRCFVVGNPLGLDTQSLADGIIRDIEFVKYAQEVESVFTTTPTFKGNSGSPIINEKCKVIGIHTFGLTREIEVYDANNPYPIIGFALPSAETLGGGMSQRIAEPVTDWMIANTADYTKKAWLGIDWWEPVNVNNASTLGLIGTAFNVQGIWLRTLDASSPLLSATGDGPLAEDDVILSVDGIKVGDLPGQTHITTVTWFKVKTDTITVTWITPPSLTVKTSVVTLSDDFGDHPEDDVPLGGNLKTNHESKLQLAGKKGSQYQIPVDPEFDQVVVDLVNTTYTYRNPDDWPGVETLSRIAASDYGDADGDIPSGADRPNARDISNDIFDQTGDTLPNPDNTTDWFWVFGQYVDHDIDLTGTDSGDPFNIAVPSGDIYFDPGMTGNVEIPLNRSLYAAGTGTGGVPREQVTEITSYMDLTNVYGTTTSRASWLRAYTGGLLKTSQGNLPPLNDGTQDNASNGPGTAVYLCGDVRANENTALLCAHTLFLRNHNWWAEQISNKEPTLTDEEVYQKARVINEGEYQSIIVNEFLPLLLGSGNIPTYTGYDSGAATTIDTEFSTAAYRLGHSLVSETLWRLDSKNQQLPLGNLSLKDAFFAPSKFANEGGPEPVIRGATEHICQALDAKIVPSLRNFLFGAPGSGGLDLAALNIQRGRDHGIPDYNTVRVALGLSAKSTFAEITSDTTVASALSTAYSGDISKIDLWVGGLCEDHYNSSMLGETFYTIVRNQFLRLRNGDELWYENRLNADQITYVNSIRLSDIIMRNTNILGLRKNIMQKN